MASSEQALIKHIKDLQNACNTLVGQWAAIETAYTKEGNDLPTLNDGRSLKAGIAVFKTIQDMHALLAGKDIDHFKDDQDFSSALKEFLDTNATEDDESLPWVSTETYAFIEAIEFLACGDTIDAKPTDPQDTTYKCSSGTHDGDHKRLTFDDSRLNAFLKQLAETSVTIAQVFAALSGLNYTDCFDREADDAAEAALEVDLSYTAIKDLSIAELRTLESEHRFIEKMTTPAQREHYDIKLYDAFNVLLKVNAIKDPFFDASLSDDRRPTLKVGLPTVIAAYLKELDETLQADTLSPDFLFAHITLLENIGLTPDGPVKPQQVKALFAANARIIAKIPFHEQYKVLASRATEMLDAIEKAAGKHEEVVVDESAFMSLQVLSAELRRKLQAMTVFNLSSKTSLETRCVDSKTLAKLAIELGLSCEDVKGDESNHETVMVLLERLNTATADILDEMSREAVNDVFLMCLMHLNTAHLSLAGKPLNAFEDIKERIAKNHPLPDWEQQTFSLIKLGELVAWCVKLERKMLREMLSEKDDLLTWLFEYVIEALNTLPVLNLATIKIQTGWAKFDMDETTEAEDLVSENSRELTNLVTTLTEHTSIELMDITKKVRVKCLVSLLCCDKDKLSKHAIEFLDDSLSSDDVEIRDAVVREIVCLESKWSLEPKTPVKDTVSDGSEDEIALPDISAGRLSPPGSPRRRRIFEALLGNEADTTSARRVTLLKTTFEWYFHKRPLPLVNHEGIDWETLRSRQHVVEMLRILCQLGETNGLHHAIITTFSDMLNRAVTPAVGEKTRRTLRPQSSTKNIDEAFLKSLDEFFGDVIYSVKALTTETDAARELQTALVKAFNACILETEKRLTTVYHNTAVRRIQATKDVLENPENFAQSVHSPQKTQATPVEKQIAEIKGAIDTYWAQCGMLFETFQKNREHYRAGIHSTFFECVKSNVLAFYAARLKALAVGATARSMFVQSDLEPSLCKAYVQMEWMLAGWEHEAEQVSVFQTRIKSFLEAHLKNIVLNFNALRETTDTFKLDEHKAYLRFVNVQLTLAASLKDLPEEALKGLMAQLRDMIHTKACHDVQEYIYQELNGFDANRSQAFKVLIRNLYAYLVGKKTHTPAENFYVENTERLHKICVTYLDKVFLHDPEHIFSAINALLDSEHFDHAFKEDVFTVWVTHLKTELREKQSLYIAAAGYFEARLAGTANDCYEQHYVLISKTYPDADEYRLVQPLMPLVRLICFLKAHERRLPAFIPNAVMESVLKQSSVHSDLSQALSSVALIQTARQQVFEAINYVDGLRTCDKALETLKSYIRTEHQNLLTHLNQSNSYSNMSSDARRTGFKLSPWDLQDKLSNLVRAHQFLHATPDHPAESIHYFFEDIATVFVPQCTMSLGDTDDLTTIESAEQAFEKLMRLIAKLNGVIDDEADPVPDAFEHAYNVQLGEAIRNDHTAREQRYLEAALDKVEQIPEAGAGASDVVKHYTWMTRALEQVQADKGRYKIMIDCIVKTFEKVLHTPGLMQYYAPHIFTPYLHHSEETIAIYELSDLRVSLASLIMNLPENRDDQLSRLNDVFVLIEAMQPVFMAHASTEFITALLEALLNAPITYDLSAHTKTRFLSSLAACINAGEDEAQERTVMHQYTQLQGMLDGLGLDYAESPFMNQLGQYAEADQFLVDIQTATTAYAESMPQSVARMRATVEAISASLKPEEAITPAQCAQHLQAIEQLLNGDKINDMHVAEFVPYVEFLTELRMLIEKQPSSEQNETSYAQHLEHVRSLQMQCADALSTLSFVSIDQIMPKRFPSNYFKMLEQSLQEKLQTQNVFPMQTFTESLASVLLDELNTFAELDLDSGSQLYQTKYNALSYTYNFALACIDYSDDNAFLWLDAMQNTFEALLGRIKAGHPNVCEFLTAHASPHLFESCEDGQGFSQAPSFFEKLYSIVYAGEKADPNMLRVLGALLVFASPYQIKLQFDLESSDAVQSNTYTAVQLSSFLGERYCKFPSQDKAIAGVAMALGASREEAFGASREETLIQLIKTDSDILLGCLMEKQHETYLFSAISLGLDSLLGKQAKATFANQLMRDLLMSYPQDVDRIWQPQISLLTSYRPVVKKLVQHIQDDQLHTLLSELIKEKRYPQLAAVLYVTPASRLERDQKLWTMLCGKGDDTSLKKLLRIAVVGEKHSDKYPNLVKEVGALSQTKKKGEALITPGSYIHYKALAVVNNIATPHPDRALSIIASDQRAKVGMMKSKQTKTVTKYKDRAEAVYGKFFKKHKIKTFPILRENKTELYQQVTKTKWS